MVKASTHHNEQTCLHEIRKINALKTYTNALIIIYPRSKHSQLGSTVPKKWSIKDKSHHKNGFIFDKVDGYGTISQQRTNLVIKETH